MAEKNGVSRNTVKNTVLADPKFTQKCRDKKNANTRAILAHMDAHRSTVCQLMDRYLAELLDVEQFAKLTPIQLASALCMVLDKFAPGIQSPQSGNQGNVILVNATDDPLTAAIREKAGELRESDTVIIDDL